MSRARRALVPVLLSALTVGVAIWTVAGNRPERFAAAVVPNTPEVPTIRVNHVRESSRVFQAGVSIIVYGNDPYFEHKAQILLNRLAMLGANSVALVIPVFQSGPADNEVSPDQARTPNDAKVALFATEARRRGFTVMLRPLLDIGIPETPANWRGSIRPQDPGLWQSKYADVMMSYARLAQSNHVDVLTIGSELDSTESDTGYWQRLIKSVRSVYNGQVTYSSNWAKGYPTFGRSLDFISVDAYFPLNRPATATAEELAAAWQQWINRLATMRRTFGKPLVLTELGATSLSGSFQQPWVWDNGQPIDLGAQQRYYQAACQSVLPKFSGVYWWMYTLDPPAKPSLDRGFTVAGKPAEAALANCFGGSVPPATRPSH